MSTISGNKVLGALLGLLVAWALIVAGGIWYGSELVLNPPWHENRAPEDGLKPPDDFIIESWSPGIHDPLTDFGIAYEDVDFPAVDGTTLRGWWVPRRRWRDRRHRHRFTARVRTAATSSGTCRCCERAATRCCYSTNGNTESPTERAAASRTACAKATTSVPRSPSRRRGRGSKRSSCWEPRRAAPASSWRPLEMNRSMP